MRISIFVFTIYFGAMLEQHLSLVEWGANFVPGILPFLFIGLIICHIQDIREITK